MEIEFFKAYKKINNSKLHAKSMAIAGRFARHHINIEWTGVGKVWHRLLTVL